jgi:RecJ-like exonuclease
MSTTTTTCRWCRGSGGYTESGCTQPHRCEDCHGSGSVTTCDTCGDSEMDRHGNCVRCAEEAVQAKLVAAKAAGWTQCGYPHKLVLDMWYHPDSEACPDGKYIDTETLLELLEEDE